MYASSYLNILQKRNEKAKVGLRSDKNVPNNLNHDTILVSMPPMLDT